MKNPFKDFLYFSRGERRGILVLIIGIILIFLSGYIYSFRQNSRQLSEEEARIQAAALKEYDNFIGSVREQEKNENSRFKKSERYKKRTVVLAPFDPNRTDSVTFCRLGLPAWMAKNILRYQSKGGKFRKTEDFKKVYEFSKSVGLPTKLKDLEFDSSQLEEIAKIAVEMKDIDHNPYKITKEMVEESIRKLEAM